MPKRPSRTHQLYLFALALVALLLFSLPAAAQLCDPSIDPDCTGDGIAPQISIDPDQGTWTIESGTSTAIAYRIGFNDEDGLQPGSVSISTTHNSVTTPVTGYTWTPNSTGTFGLAQGTLRLSSAGQYTFTASADDRTGKHGTASVQYTVVVTDPHLPVVETTPHHGEYRNTGLGATARTYSLPPYISLGVPRTIGLYYDSQQADPTGFVQLDVRPEAGSGSGVVAMALQIFDAATNTAVTTEDVWSKDPTGLFMRVGAQWSMRDKPTGAYNFYADVKSYWADQSFKVRRVPVRVLVINERNSKYGAGWSLAGVQRIHSPSPMTDEGLLVNEGNGIARWFAKDGTCSAAECRYKTPAGDFSTLVWNNTAGQWKRTYPNGIVITFSSAGVMTAVADRFGRTTTYAWQNTPEAQPVPILASVTDPIGHVTRLSYHWGISLAQIIDPNDRIASFGYTNADLTSITGPVSVTATYDAQHKLTSYTDWRGTWDLAYDERGTLRTFTAPAVTANWQLMRPVTTFRSIQSLVTLTPYATNICCNTAAPVPSSEAFITITDAGGHTVKVLNDRYGSPMKVIDPLGTVVTEARYNDNGLPANVTTGATTTVYEWNARGQLLSQVAGSSLVYQASYTLEGYLEFEMSGGSATWFAYGPRGEIVQSWYGKREDQFKNATAYLYDSLYRLVSAAGPKGERLEWAYLGNPWGNKSEMRLIRQDGTQLITTTTYDGAGRTRRVTNPLSQATTTTWDTLNRVTKVVDANGRTATYTYTGPDLTSVTDTAGKIYRFTYNALGWLESEKFPGLSVTRNYRYNPDGMVTFFTDRRGMQVSSEYDAAHRLNRVIADGLATSYSYPDADTVVMVNNESRETIHRHTASGRIGKTTMSLAGPESSNIYEIENILDYHTGWMPTGFHVRRYQYGSPVATDTIRFTRDFAPTDPALGSRYSIQDFSGLTTTLSFDTSGRHVKTDYPNNVTQSKSYTNDGRLSSVLFNSGWVHENLGASYTYDLLNRTINRTSGDGGTIDSYLYDAIGQLSEYRTTQRSYVNGAEQWTVTNLKGYSYDAAGNRIDSGGSMRTNSNRYAYFDGYAHYYDAEGNLTRKAKTGFEQQFTWNSLGQLASVTTNGVTVSYGYSPSGRRVRRTQGDQAIFYVYNGDDLLMEVDGYGNPLRAYTHLPGVDLPLSVRVTSGAQQGTYYYTMENPGHVTGLLSTTGNVAARHRYEPWGVAEIASDGTGQPLRYMAREADPVTGMYYVRARWYDPVDGRFISEDPIGLTGGLNTYVYVGNDPINGRDPSGLCCTKDNPLQLPMIYATLYPDGRIIIRGFDANALWRAMSTGEGANDIGGSSIGPRPVPSIGPRPSGEPEPPQAPTRPSRQCMRASIIAGANMVFDVATLAGPGLLGRFGKVLSKSVMARPHSRAALGVNQGRDGAAVLSMADHGRFWAGNAGRVSLAVATGAGENQLTGDGSYGIVDALIDATPLLNSIEAVGTALDACFGD